MRWASGARWRFSLMTAGWRWTTIWWKMLCRARHKKHHPSHRPGQEKLALHRGRRSGGTQRDHLHRHRKLPSARPGSLRLPERRPDASAQMTNHQVADVTPEAWGKAQRTPAALATRSIVVRASISGIYHTLRLCPEGPRRDGCVERTRLRFHRPPT